MDNYTGKYKIAILWANPYNKNMGVAALAYSLLVIFDEIINKLNVNAEITIIGSSRKGTDTLEIVDKKITFNNMEGVYLTDWRSVFRLIVYPWRIPTSKLFGFNSIFDISEGDSFSDIYGEERFRIILNTKRLFNILGKKQVLLPQTIGPFKNPKNKKKAFKLMRKLDGIICRDNLSYNYTKEFLPGKSIEETIDVAFCLPYVKQNFSSEKINVGLNISALLWNGGYTRNNQFDMKSDYQKLIHNILNYFSNQENIQIHLISHVIPDDNQVEDDFEVSKIISHYYPKVLIANRFNDPIEAKSYISGMDFFVGSRMHSCIAAFSSGVPVFPVAYSRKFNGLFKGTLQYKWMGDCINEDENQILEHLKLAFEKKDGLAQNIENANNSIVAQRIEVLKNIITEALI